MSDKLKSANSLIFSLFMIVLLSALTGCSGFSGSLKDNLAGRDVKTGIYTFNDNLNVGAVGPDMVIVPDGSFIMGDQHGVGAPNEQAHEVHINQPFAIGKFEITVGQFREFIEATDYVTSAEQGEGCFTFGEDKKWNVFQDAGWDQPHFYQSDKHPVVCVSWHDAVAYTNWLSEQSGQQYHLPTEAQWEYVARAGTHTNFWWGNGLDSDLDSDLGSDNVKCTQANCCLSQTWMEKQTLPVGSYQANNFGVYDTAGNVWEWTASNYTTQYNGEELESADVLQLDTMRALRGGSWYSFQSDTRAARRGKNWSRDKFSTIGFRVARVISRELEKVALHGN